MSGGSPGGVSSGITTGSSGDLPQRLEVLGVVQHAERLLDVFAVGIRGDRAHARVAEQAAAQLRHAAVVVDPGQDATAFEDPVGAVGVGAAAALLDHQQLRHHQSFLRIRGPRCSKPLAR